MMSDAEYAEHQRKAADFSLTIIGLKEDCGCDQCEEMREYYEMKFRVLMARC